MLYNLNIYNFYFQPYLNKAGEKIKTTRKIKCVLIIIRSLSLNTAERLGFYSPSRIESSILQELRTLDELAIERNS